jgi:hypothetical protein
MRAKMEKAAVPYWDANGRRVAADVIGDLLEYIDDLAEWVLSLKPAPRYSRLRELVRTGRVSGINELGLQLADALDAAGDRATPRARVAAESLGHTILWRKTQWAEPYLETTEFWPPPDPATLVLFECD